MQVLKSEILPLREEMQLLLVRQMVKEKARGLAFSLLDQTKLVTAASELGRNVLRHGGGGTVQIEIVERAERRGLRLVFEDAGPGIPDIAQAMEDGFTTRGGLGLGLGGSKRLMNEFEIQSLPGGGTRVIACRWVA